MKRIVTFRKVMLTAAWAMSLVAGDAVEDIIEWELRICRRAGIRWPIAGELVYYRR